MSDNGWRPKWVRNNNFTYANERSALAKDGIYLGAQNNNAPVSKPTANTPPKNAPTMGARFAPNTSQPTPEQLASHLRAQQPRERFGVPNERLGFRDEWISRRHREWGKDAPMVDIDFLVVDYNHCRVVALVEYKCAIRDDGIATAPPDFTRANYKTLINMADGLGVPMFAVYYNRDAVTFTIYPANGLARRYASNGMTFSEADWVEKIYALSGRSVPDDLRSRLSKTK